MTALTREIVVDCYRAFLGREPDSEAVIREHIETNKTLDAFLDAIMELPGFTWAAQRSIAHAIRGVHLRGTIDIGGTQAQMDALVRHIREVWAKYGESDPYFSVLTHDKYRGKTLAEETRTEFFASGARATRAFFNLCSRNGLVPKASGTVLDLGCGLGRIGEHLSAKFQSYIGVDISSPHLDQARARFQEVGRKNATFRLLSDFLAMPDQVDVAYSMIVLQHNPPPIIALLIEKLCEVLRPGGILFFQVPVGLFDYKFDLAAYLAKVPAHGRMEMHAIPQREVHRILDRNSCRVVEAFPDGAIGIGGLSYAFLAVKQA